MRAAPVLLALTLLWSPVTLDCEGAPESGVVYEVVYVWRQCDGYWLDEPPPCPAFHILTRTPYTVWETVIGQADPPMGAGYFLDVRVRDGAGNWSPWASLVEYGGQPSCD